MNSAASSTASSSSAARKPGTRPLLTERTRPQIKAAGSRTSRGSQTGKGIQPKAEPSQPTIAREKSV